MGQFAADADFDIFDDEYTVKRSYCKSEYCCQEYLKAKSQSDELMSMEPFPYHEIQCSADRYLVENAKNEEEKIKMVKDWLIRWLTSNDPRPLVLKTRTSQTIGRGINKGESSITRRTAAQTVLRKNSSGEFDIITSFPIQ
jgi:hypothetical protein